MKPEQAKVIAKSITPMLQYLNKLQRRMEQVGFPLADPFYQAVMKARDGVYSLSISLHYLSCTGGVGRAPKRS